MKQILFKACEHGHLEIVKHLFENGLSVDEDWFSMVIASGKGHFDLVKLLLEHGAQPGFGTVPACVKGHVKILELLLDYGADVDYERHFPLELACYHDHLECVKLLLERGVNPDMKWIERIQTTDEIRAYLRQWKYRVDGDEYIRSKEMIG
jgi:ankyrin repeat protein